MTCCAKNTAHFLFFALTLLFLSGKTSFAQPNCDAYKEGQPFLAQKDVFHFYTRAQMAESFKQIYRADARLIDRVYFAPDSDSFFLPVDSKEGKIDIRIPNTFIEAISWQIEEALDRELAEYVFFPDMGHTHFLIPQTRWDSFYQYLNPYTNARALFSNLFHEKDAYFLYHTAERLQFPPRDPDTSEISIQDPYLRYRYDTRNLVAQNEAYGKLFIIHHPDKKKHNSAHELDGYKYFSFGIFISANKNGCFRYTHREKEYYYDINLVGYPYLGSDED